MFERYTEKARRVIFYARYEATQRGATSIEPEHILLGLLREDRAMLKRFVSDGDATLRSIRDDVDQALPLLAKISPIPEMPLADNAKRALAYAYEESDRLQDRHIGTEHLLLGILREERSLACEILYEHGLRLSAAREVLARKSPLKLVEEALLHGGRELDLSRLGLSEVPEAIAPLRQLKKLFLNDNRITHLPAFIGNLTELEVLDLSGNALTELPDSLMSLRSLKFLGLHGNDALGIPTEILGPDPATHPDYVPASPEAVLGYYYRIRSGNRSLNEAKLILVGRGEVGKTSIVNRLVYKSFKEEEKTEGIQITKWNFNIKRKERVQLNIWDFGGQEIMHATHQFFFTERSIYLLVLNGRGGGEDADAEYWLKLIESFGGESPVIVVLNKIMEHPFDMNRRALLNKYPAIRDFVRTDCRDNFGLDDLLYVLERETDRLEHLRDSFPESWFSIKNRLAGMDTNFLSYDDYRGECARRGETDPAAQDVLSGYLHSLGVVLNYKDDPRLQDTHVLNPIWVTNGIYSIINSPLLERQKGEIHLRDLDGILYPGDYPARMHRFLFDLMKKFELCFSFPNDEYHYLIPELLDKQEPVEAEDFSPSECLNFQYHYSVLPEGLLPRFIVRTHALSEGLPRWRTGVILEFEGNRALVKADVQDKKVYVSVSGPSPGRRQLLAIIRSDFEYIHKGFRNLQSQEIVPLPEHPDTVIPFQELLVLEQSGMLVIPKVVQNRVVVINVNELLNGLDLDRTRRRIGTSEEWRRPLRLFYSYSHKDESLRNDLETHLKLLQRQGLIETWHDRKIDAGGDWKQVINDNLSRADIILLLVSADFIASDYCYEKEMTLALDRRKDGTARVIPVIVRDVNWKGAPFAGLQALPKDGLAITKWADKDSAWRDVSEGIEKVVNEIRRETE